MNTSTDHEQTITINKLLCHKNTKLGDRLYQRGAYYLVTGIGGKGVGEHWICTLDTEQKPCASSSI